MQKTELALYREPESEHESFFLHHFSCVHKNALANFGRQKILQDNSQENSSKFFLVKEIIKKLLKILSPFHLCHHFF